MDCGTPPSITNGSPGIPTTTTFTGTVVYSCNNGYALFGNATSTCQANATWSKSPECRGTYRCTLYLSTLLGHTLTHTGIFISVIQSDAPILIGGSVTITCTTDSPADSIMLFQDNEPLHDTINNQTALTYNISLVTDSIHGNIFKCEAKLTERTYFSDIAFGMVTISVEGKYNNCLQLL